VDVDPALAELAGLPLPKTIEGISFKSLLDHPDRPWKQAAFSQYSRVPKGGLMGCSMRTERYRFTVWVARKDHNKIDAIENSTITRSTRWRTPTPQTFRSTPSSWPS
jgi:iduronate 2-sulfatase